MRQHGRFPLVLLLAGLACLAGCGGGTTTMPTIPSAPALTDAVTSITNMNPAPGTPLQAGQTVIFSGTAGYRLASADVGIVTIIIQDQNNRSLPSSGSSSVVAARGTADATLTQTVTLPEAGVTGVRVFFALVPAGSSSTNAVASVSYPVR